MLKINEKSIMKREEKKISEPLCNLRLDEKNSKPQES